MPQLDLGELRLTMKNSSTELHLTSSASFGILDSADNEEDIVRALLHGDPQDRPWFSPCAPFRLRLQLHVEALTSVETHEILQQAVVRSMERTQTWEHFGLYCTSIETSTTRDLVMSYYSVLLSPQEARSDSAGRLPHKLEQDVSIQRVKPPDGVSSLSLESVQLEMRLLGHAAPAPNTAAAGHDEEIDLAVVASSPSSTGIMAAQTAEPEDRQDLNIMDKPLASRCDDDRDTWLTPVLRLLDAAMRSAISAESRHLGPGIQIDSQVAFIRLDRLMPAIWAPGFILEQSAKARFLPTINHATMSVAGRQNPHSSFGLKCQEIQRKWQVNRSLESTAAIRLWRMLHHAAMRRSCGKRLQPVIFHSAMHAQTDQVMALDVVQKDHISSDDEILETGGCGDEDALLDMEWLARIEAKDENSEDWHAGNHDNEWSAVTVKDELFASQSNDPYGNANSLSSSLDLISSPLSVAAHYDALMDDNNDLSDEQEYILET